MHAGLTTVPEWLLKGVKRCGQDCGPSSVALLGDAMLPKAVSGEAHGVALRRWRSPCRFYLATGTPTAVQRPAPEGPRLKV